MINKKASKWMSPYLFFIFIFVGVFIVIGVVLFYSVKVDIRDEETKIITNKIIDCISEQGEFFVPEENFDYYDNCDLNKEVINNGNYYILVEYIKEGSSRKLFETGVANFEILCGLGEEAEGDLPECSNNYLTLKTGEKIRVFVGSNHVGGEI
jgi:hypothetical protein